MAEPKELTRLLRQLRQVSSPLERMKMLARAWRSLRRLDPAQRKALADQVGVADAADLIEKLAVSKGGLNPSMVQRALESVGNRNVGDLRELVSGLRDPEGRKRLLQRGLDAASGSLAGPETDELPVELTAAGESLSPAGPETDELPLETTAAAAPPPEPAPREAERRAPGAVAIPVAAAAAATAKKPQAAPKPLETVRVAAADGPSGRSGRRPSGAARPRTQEPSPASATRPKLLDRVGVEPMLARRFRLLREYLDEARGMNARQLRDLLDLFPDGWAQRRVLDMLLKRGIPDSLNKAIFLIEQLDSPVARRWCVKTLLHQRDLSPEQRETLLERHELSRVVAPPR